MRFEEFVNESSLSRIWKHNIEHDCAALTAFRKTENCGDGKPYTTRENAARNRSLLAKLKSLGYGVTSLIGIYPEGGNTSKEVYFFVVDIEDKGNLLSDVKRLGEQFEQDSVLFIPKGSINGEDKAFLIGTNSCDNNWLGYGKKEVFSNGRIGYSTKIYTSYVNGRPFIFEEVGKEIKSPGSGMGIWMMNRVAQKRWEDLIEE